MGKNKSTKGDVKEEQKRYFLCEYCGLAPEKEPRVFYTEKGLENFLNNVRRLNELLKKNSDSNEHLNNCGINRFFFGNVTYVEEDGKYIVSLHMYNRLTPKMTISEIDALTSNKTEDEIIEKYRPYLRTISPNKPDINIMYFEEKNKKERKDNTPIVRIKYTPVLYKGDERYMQRSYVEGAVKDMARLHDFTFSNEMANEFCFYHVNQTEEFRFPSKGIIVYKFKNGQFEKHYSNYEFNIKFSDGSYRIIRKEKELFQYPDGILEFKDKKGNKSYMDSINDIEEGLSKSIKLKYKKNRSHPI